MCIFSVYIIIIIILIVIVITKLLTIKHQIYRITHSHWPTIKTHTSKTITGLAPLQIKEEMDHTTSVTSRT